MLSPYVFRDPLRVGASCRLSSIERQRFDRGEFIVLERDGDMDIAVPPSCGPGCSALFHPATKKCQRTSQSGTRGKDRTDNSLAHPLTVGWRIRGTVDSKKPWIVLSPFAGNTTAVSASSLFSHARSSTQSLLTFLILHTLNSELKQIQILDKLGLGRFASFILLPKADDP
jgi:hypothetical protein